MVVYPGMMRASAAVGSCDADVNPGRPGSVHTASP